MGLPEFQKEVYTYYKKNKRQMIWREKPTPYFILVSEVMLQQTQVPRVTAKFPEFIKKFPDFKSLANSSVSDLLKVWKGMGYNRRALYLKKIAEVVIEKYSGKLPEDPNLLDELPGIGYATAHSIAAFAFNHPGIFIETNIRRVFIHFFFSDKTNVDDKNILPLVEKTLDRKNPREWYYALMDYGTMLAKTQENANKKSKHYSVQSRFEGSMRQMRGKVLQELIQSGPLKYQQLLEKVTDETRLTKSLEALQREGFVMERKGVYHLRGGV